MSFSAKMTTLFFAVLSIGLIDAFSGDGTWYNTGLGACGWNNNDNEYVAALNAPQYGNQANPNNAEVCGRCANVNANGRTVKVKIVDKCPVCQYGSLDLSPSAFKQLASLDAGRIGISWDWTSC